VWQENGAGCIDPAEFAARVRQLAMDAHRVLKSRTAAKSELVQLCRQIDELRRESRVDLSREIDRWLHQANEQIEGLGAELSNDQNGSPVAMDGPPSNADWSSLVARKAASAITRHAQTTAPTPIHHPRLQACDPPNEPIARRRKT
jgi:hypothetical protein